MKTFHVWCKNKQSIYPPRPITVEADIATVTPGGDLVFNWRNDFGSSNAFARGTWVSFREVSTAEAAQSLLEPQDHAFKWNPTTRYPGELKP